MILPDLLARDLRLVFCGTGASAASAKAGAYYAHPGNAFWRALFQAGFTPRQFAPDEFRDLLDLRIGLTDICKHSAGNDSELAISASDVDAVREKILLCEPRNVAFTSKTAWRLFAGVRVGASVEYGWQEAKISETRCYVLPSPSGQARRYWDIAPWIALRRHIHDPF